MTLVLCPVEVSAQKSALGSFQDQVSQLSLIRPAYQRETEIVRAIVDAVGYQVLKK
jgi:hypothetical protein